ncbi:MAG TPA: NAD-dependent epimerase/dehydratase family protein [Jiangellales bacterium]|nr:NAD-dependent epimerase/dehydratase family protein [Jiangellales bacterium]
MRLVVTGATGFVGGALARHLLRDGHEVVALVRSPGRASGLAAAGAELAAGDVTDPDAVRAALEGADGLYHVAGWYKVGSRDPEEGRRVNVVGTRTVLGAAAEAGTPRVVYTSTLAVNSDTGGRVVDETYRFTGEHLSAYDDTKAQAHRVAEEMARAGLPVVTVMPGLVYGPGDTSQTGALVRRVVTGGRPVVPAGGRVCWGYVDDVVAGHVLAFERGVPAESYMLAGPPASLAEGLRAAATIAGTRGPIVVPSAAVRGAARVAGLVERLVPLPADYAGESQRAALATYLGSPARAERELGWSCRPLLEGMSATVAAEHARGSWP